MKKFQIIITALLLVLSFNCKDNVIDPGSGKGELVVQNKIVTQGEVVQIDDYPLFVMNYSGDYGFSNYLKKGLGLNKSYLNGDKNRWGCTCFSALEDSSKIFGRNFDYYHHIALVLYTHSPGVYSSISVADISYLGFDEKSTAGQLQGSSSISRSPYCCVDGLNEKGVSIGIMSVPSMQPPYDPQKKNLACCDIIRLVLDYAASTDEAVNLINQYNFKDEQYPSHYLIADKSGRSAVIEFVDKKVSVIRNNEPFQVATNFIITGSSAPQSTTCWRYNRAYKALKDAGGNINETSAMSILQSVSQSITMWSCVYNMNSFSLNICVNKKYNNTYAVIVKNE